MVKSKENFRELFPCQFYDPADIMDPALMYTVPEIARLLQGLDPDRELDPDTENVLLDWAVPWIMINADQLVIADPTDEDQPGHYGLRTDSASISDSSTGNRP